MDDALVAWDDEHDPDGNVAHIAQHGLTPEEVEDVLLDPASSRGFSRSSGLPTRFGHTRTGRHIVVIFSEESDDPRVVRPVTAYDVPEPA
jgi:uncharacterized DUF497 family protein